MNQLISDKLSTFIDKCRIYGIVAKYINFFGNGRNVTKKGIIQFVISTNIEDDVVEISNRVDVIIDELLKNNFIVVDSHNEYEIVSEIPQEN